MVLMVDVELSPDTRTGPSSSIWRNADIIEMIRNPRCGHYFFEDFMVGKPGHLITLEADATAATADGAERGGSITLTTGGTDNNECYVGGDYGGFEISDTGGDAHKLWFEARVKVSAIAAQTVFVGMIDPAAVAANMLLDAGTVGDFDYIGFRINEADPDGIDFAYRISGGSEVVAVNEAQVAVADTYYKLGFVYDPLEDTSRRITIYVNGTANATYVTGTNIAAASFPDAQLLTPAIGIKTNAAVTKVLECDWVRVAQERK